MTTSTDTQNTFQNIGNILTWNNSEKVQQTELQQDMQETGSTEYTVQTEQDFLTIFRNTKDSKFKRRLLSALSSQMKKKQKYFIEQGIYLPLNHFIIEYYEETYSLKDSTWHLFQEWKKLERNIKKGEKGFPVWGKPRNKQGQTEEEVKEENKAEVKAQNTQNEEDQDDFSFFPLCYIFHEDQTEEGKAH